MAADLNVKRDCRFRRFGFYGILIAAAMVLPGCGGGQDEPEQMLRQWLAEAEVEAEERNRRALMSRVSESYTDARGNRPSDIENVLRYYFLRQKSVSLVTTVGALEVFGDSAAEIELTVAMAGTRGGLNLSADVWNFELELEKLDGEWLLIGARWGQLGEELR